MLECSFKCLQKLSSMDCFKDIQLKYDVARDKEGVVKGVEVIYMVKEAGRLRSSVSANAGTQTSDAVSIPLPPIIISNEWFYS